MLGPGWTEFVALVAAFAIACIEKEQFWMLPEGSNTANFEQRTADIVARRNPG